MAARKSLARHEFPPRRLDPNEARPNDIGTDLGITGLKSENIEEDDSSEQPFETSFAGGVAEAANHPEQPVYVHGESRREPRREES